MGTELDVNKITAEVITELSKDMAQKLFGKAKEFFVDLKNKDEVDFGYAFENYLSYSTAAVPELLMFPRCSSYVFA